MIKETVDAVRLAELEAEKIISTAEENAQGKKNQIKTQAKEYRADSLKEAKNKAEQEMKSMIESCNAYEEQVSSDIDAKVAELKKAAESRKNRAVEMVINALV